MTPEILLILASLAGALGHYLKKWARGEIIGNLLQYLAVDYPKSTVAMLMTLAGAVAAILASGVLHGMDAWTIAGLGFTTGYTIDSAVNKGL